MKYQWILFDADGTLFDFQTAQAEALQQTFIDFQIRFQPIYLVYYEEHNDVLWAHLEQGKISGDQLKVERFQRLLNQINCEGDAKGLSDRYLQHLSEADQLLESAKSVVARLRQTHRLALITNGIQTVQLSRLQKSGLSDQFEELFISEAIGVSKPQSGIFEYAFAKMGAPPKESVLIVGDSLSSDIKGGVNYGIDTCWFNPSKKDNSSGLQPTYEISKLIELYSIIEER